jgi:transglutaminase-like putative cysteine protease/predicted glutamine amidotransferase
MSSDLFAVSFDSIGSPSLKLKVDRMPEAPPSTWGFGWYPHDDAAAVVLKDPANISGMSFGESLHGWERFRSSIFLCYYRKVAKNAKQQDTPPFMRTHAGRVILFVHSGDLARNFRDARRPGDHAVYEPIGRTDSEFAFCRIMNLLQSFGARRIAGVPRETFHNWLQDIDQFGEFNTIISDGTDLIVYRDLQASKNIYFTRCVPPHQTTLFANNFITADYGDELNAGHSMLMISTEPMAGVNWWQLAPGQMLVVRRGQVNWSSHPLPQAQDQLPLLGTPAVCVTQPMGTNPAEATLPQAAQSTNASIPATAVDSQPPIQPQQRTMTVEHRTTYQYSSPVEFSDHVLRLEPLLDPFQQVHEYSLTIEPDGIRNSYEDVFGNQLTHMRIEIPYQELTVCARSRVTLAAPPMGIGSHRRFSIPLVWMPWQRQMMHAYLLPTELPESQLEQLNEFARSAAERQDFDLYETLVDINNTIYHDFTYIPGSTTLETTPFEVYMRREGVCQDFANLFICLARLLGIPARYRVGYIYTGADYENQVQSEASHAWAEVYFPTVGWRGFDPTNGCVAGVNHIRVAVGRNYRDATPTSGTIFKGGGTETLSVAVRVEATE